MKSDAAEMELVETVTAHHPAPALQGSRALASNAPANSPMGSALAFLQAGGSMEQLDQMMALQDRWEANEARKAYNSAFSDFKAEAVRILKARAVTDGPLKGKSYAELHNVVDAVTPALSKHGLSASWKLTKDEPAWIEVTCTLKHALGHSESVSMGGPPDAGGAKNAIQARASTVSYLERYTLKAVTGVAEGGQDDDGAGGAGGEAKTSEFAQGWIDYAMSVAGDRDAFTKAIREARKAFNEARDIQGLRAFNAKVSAA